MPSPFPGMNPYIEQRSDWLDFHNNFIMRMQAALTKQLGGRYIVKSEERLLLHELSAEVEKQRFLEIRTQDDERLVTIVELLSPSNKNASGDYDVYISKRNQVLRSETNFVEIDLRRGGKRPTSPELPHCDYYVLVSRQEERPEVSVWPFGLRERFPIIPIPLLKPDHDVSMNLKAVLDRTYDETGLVHRIYVRTPEPPLSPADVEWAKQFLPKRRRSK